MSVSRYVRTSVRPQKVFSNFNEIWYVHRVSKNVPPMACYNFDTHEQILIFFGRNVTDKVGIRNQKIL